MPVVSLFMPIRIQGPLSGRTAEHIQRSSYEFPEFGKMDRAPYHPLVLGGTIGDDGDEGRRGNGDGGRGTAFEFASDC